MLKVIKRSKRGADLPAVRLHSNSLWIHRVCDKTEGVETLEINLLDLPNAQGAFIDIVFVSRLPAKAKALRLSVIKLRISLPLT